VLLACLFGDAGALRAQIAASEGPPGRPVAAASVSGLVYDSVAGRPLVRAVVQLLAEPAGEGALGGGGDGAARRVYTATTDTKGYYELREVPAGRYLATFFHPALDALGLVAVLHRIQVTSGLATQLDFAVPAPSTVWAATCPATSPADSTGKLVGPVRTAATRRPVAGAQVSVDWMELVLTTDTRAIRREPRRVVATADSAGLYVICGLPSDGRVGVRATTSAGAASGELALAVPARGLQESDLTVSRANTQVVLAADSAGLDSGTVLVRGTARLAGTVRSETGRPIGDVALLLLGTGVRGHTDQAGQFVLTNLPAGTYMLETRRLGLAPERVAVDLASGRTAHVAVTARAAVVLEAQTIYGKRRTNRAMERLAGFLKRKRLGFGHFLTREDIQRRQPFETTDLFQAMLGVKVQRSGFTSKIIMRMLGGQWCAPLLFVDGFRVPWSGDNILNDYIVPDDIAAVEVYPDVGVAPAQYGDPRGKCGSIVIWSRYAFPEVQRTAP
jgi:hypothetical protein